MRALLFYPTLVVMTLVLGVPVIIATLLGVRITPDSRLGRAPRLWSRAALWAAGVKVVVRNPEYLEHDDARVYVCNHVSWIEIFAMAAVLPRVRFVAKKELASLPIFGPAVRQVAGIFIDRANRKAAFEVYARAAEQVRGGMSVVVYPEGTRGRSYALRPFKKGPFVLAIAAQAPIVPVVTYGTREIQRKGEVAVHAGTCELTFLPAVSTAGLTYADRDALVRTVWSRMRAALEERLGVRPASPAEERRRTPRVPHPPTPSAS